MSATAPANPTELGLAPVDIKKPEPDDERYWSVTTLIGCLEKPALVGWAARETAVAAVQHHDAWRAVEQSSGTDEAVRWLANSRFRTDQGALTAADFGTQVHALCEEYALTGKKPAVTRKVFKADVDIAQACLDRFDEWLAHYQPSYIAAEVTVYNRTYGYAGTCDGFLSIDGTPLIVDYKTSKTATTAAGRAREIYPETGLQLAAYRYAELAAIWRPRRFEQFRRRYYLLSEAEAGQGYEVPKVEGGLGIKITPEFCTAYPLRCDESIFEAFLYIIEAARFVFDTSKSVVGEPLMVPERAA